MTTSFDRAGDPHVVVAVDVEVAMSRLEEIRERAEKAIVELVSLLPEQISYAEYVGANSCYGSGPYIWTDPEPYVMDEAAKLIKELLAEVARLTDERDAALGVEGIRNA